MITIVVTGLGTCGTGTAALVAIGDDPHTEVTGVDAVQLPATATIPYIYELPIVGLSVNDNVVINVLPFNAVPPGVQLVPLVI